VDQLVGDLSNLRRVGSRVCSLVERKMVRELARGVG
jgi:hypothetical protein